MNQKLYDQIKVNFTFLEEKPRWSNDETETGYIGVYGQYRAKVTYQGRSASFPYGNSVNDYENGIEPKKQDLLDCLVSDYFSQTNSFEDFANEYGYDTDSRKTEKIFKQVKKEQEKLEKIFPNRELEDLEMELREMEE